MTALTAHGVSWRKRNRRILDDVSLEAVVGGMLGVLGPNGAGKTSLLRILAGLRRPSAGEVLLDGQSLQRLPRKHVAERLAIVEQTLEVHEDMTVHESVALGRTPYRGPFDALSIDDRQAVEDALALTGMTRLASRSWRTLSGGEQQRAQLARALAQQPEVIVLDEPTNHLDIRYQLEILELLSRTDHTVVAALHDLNLAARYCDRLVMMQLGRVRAAGTAAEVLTASLIEEVYNVAAIVERSRHTGAPQASYLRVSGSRHPEGA